MLLRHPRAPVAALLLLASLTHFLYFATNTNVVSDDSLTYLGPAKQLAAGKGFLNGFGVPETRRTPGYPLFLAPMVESLAVVRVVQHLLAIALVFALYQFTLNATGSVRIAFLAGLLLAIDQPSIHHADAILTEAIFTIFVFACVALLDRNPALSGLLGGLAVLIRPIGIYFFAAAALYLVLTKRRFSAIVLFIALFAVAPLAWSYRNFRQTGQFTISTITSWSLLCDRAAATLAIRDAGDFRTNFFRHRRELLAKAGDPETAMNPNYVQRPGDRFHPERYGPIAKQVLLAHPLDYARVWLRAIVWTFLSGGATWLQQVTGLPLGIARVLILGWNALIALFALIGLRGRLGLLLAVTMAYFLVTCSVGEPSSRFRVPMFPMMAIAAATGIVRLAEAAAAARSRAASAAR